MQKKEDHHQIIKKKKKKRIVSITSCEASLIDVYKRKAASSL